DRLDGALQLGERELGCHQLEDDGTIFELGAQARDRSGENAPGIEAHRLAQPRKIPARHRGRPAVASRLLDQAGFVEELVTVERLLLVPRAAGDPEAYPYALAPPERSRRLGLVGARRPVLEQRQDDLVEDFRPPLPHGLPAKGT